VVRGLIYTDPKILVSIVLYAIDTAGKMFILKREAFFSFHVVNNSLHGPLQRFAQRSP